MDGTISESLNKTPDDEFNQRVYIPLTRLFFADVHSGAHWKHSHWQEHRI